MIYFLGLYTDELPFSDIRDCFETIEFLEKKGIMVDYRIYSEEKNSLF